MNHFKNVASAITQKYVSMWTWTSMTGMLIHFVFMTCCKTQPQASSLLSDLRQIHKVLFWLKGSLKVNDNNVFASQFNYIKGCNGLLKK